jgi:hypothetical protein
MDDDYDHDDVQRGNQAVSALATENAELRRRLDAAHAALRKIADASFDAMYFDDLRDIARAALALSATPEIKEK